MRSLVWSSVRNNSGRYIATFVAIITGVAFFTASGLIGARVTSSLEGDVDRQYGNVDLAVVLQESDEGGLTVNPGRDLTISAKSADRISSVKGVSGSAGELSAPVAFSGPNGKPVGQAVGRLWITDDELNPVDVTKGRAPTRTGEIAVDQGTADDRGLQVGDQTTLLTLAGPKPVTVVGITRFGDNDALDQSGTVSLPESAAVAWLNRGQREYQALYLRGDVSQEQLEREVRPLVPAGYRVQTGDAFLADQRDSIGSIGRALKTALQAFALLALFVGAFVIYNTFSVIVAQRLRELAVLSAIGATPRQIKRSLRLEGLVIGLIGAALGVLVGTLLVALGLAVAGAFGAKLPGGGFTFPPSVAFQGIFLGTIITLLSVMVPARRAARTEPIEALRVSAVDQKHFTKKRKVMSAGLCVLGAGLMLIGQSAAAVGLGALILFIGVIVSGPFIALGGSRLLRPLMSRFGLEGRLAVDNTARSPQRTATTANALLIGVFLVTLVTVSGESVKDFAVQEINKLSSADYVITSDGGSVDPGFVRKVAAIDGVTDVIPFRREAVTIDGKPTRFSTGDLAAIQNAADINVADGSLSALKPGTIALVKGGAKRPLGSTVTVSTNEGATRKLVVVALLDSSIDSSQLGALVDRTTFDGYVGATAPTVAFVDAKEGEQTDTKKAINKLADARPDITVVEGNALGRLIGTVFDFLIKAVDGLLLMSVVVALIGIINTLSLSILERRRELGLLRVVGMTDNRVQRMVRLESLVIAGLGTIVGLAVGLFAAWALILSISRLTDADISPGLPIGELALILALGVLLGLVASLIPSRRSTRLDVLEALEAT